MAWTELAGAKDTRSLSNSKPLSVIPSRSACKRPERRMDDLFALRERPFKAFPSLALGNRKGVISGFPGASEMLDNRPVRNLNIARENSVTPEVLAGVAANILRACSNLNGVLAPVCDGRFGQESVSFVLCRFHCFLKRFRLGVISLAARAPLMTCINPIAPFVPRAYFGIDFNADLVTLVLVRMVRHTASKCRVLTVARTRRLMIPERRCKQILSALLSGRRPGEQIEFSLK